MKGTIQPCPRCVGGRLWRDDEDQWGMSGWSCIQCGHSIVVREMPTPRPRQERVTDVASD